VESEEGERGRENDVRIEEEGKGLKVQMKDQQKK